MEFDGVSLVIPYYRDRDNARRCLDAIYAAILRLSTADRDLIEVILVDDASPQPFDYPSSPIPFSAVRLEKNRGAGAARNAGVTRSKFSHLLFVDSDVMLEDNYLRLLFAILRKKEVCVLQGVTSSVPANDPPALFHHYMAVSSSLLHRQYCRFFLLTLCMTVNKSFFLKIGGFSENYSGSGGEEYELSVRAWAETPGPILLEPALVCRHHYPRLLTRAKRVMIRSARFRRSFFFHSGLPWFLTVQPGLRVIFSVLLTFFLLMVFIRPLWAGFFYIFIGALFFVADWDLSARLVRKKSWRLAVVSVFFRQVEYLSVFCGLLLGFIRRLSQ